jgi:uncharacterized FlgJ-related protein
MIKKRSSGFNTWSPGLRLRVLSLPGLLILGMLSGILLMIYTYQKKMNIVKLFGIDLYKLLIELGFHFRQAQFITAQSAHETANFTSAIFLKNNNLFGMKQAGQRLSLGEKNGYASYRTIEDSVKDFQTYYRLNNYLKVYSDIESYSQTLKNKKYFEANLLEYQKGMRHFFNLYFVKK